MMIWVVLCFGLVKLSRQNRSILKYLREAEVGYLDEISVCKRRLNGCLARGETLIEEIATDNKFQNERCVCVWWSTSDSEEPMTKDEICNYPYPMGSYSSEHGYSSLKHWQPEKEIK